MSLAEPDQKEWQRLQKKPVRALTKGPYRLYNISNMQNFGTTGKYNDEDSKLGEQRHSEPGGWKPVPVARSRISLPSSRLKCE